MAFSAVVTSAENFVIFDEDFGPVEIPCADISTIKLLKFFSFL